jgi:hypothetical protein
MKRRRYIFAFAFWKDVSENMLSSLGDGTRRQGDPSSPALVAAGLYGTLKQTGDCVLN